MQNEAWSPWFVKTTKIYSRKNIIDNCSHKSLLKQQYKSKYRILWTFLEGKLLNTLNRSVFILPKPFKDIISLNIKQTGGALIHVMKYLGSSIQPDPKADREELEKLMDLIQPGWRKVVVKERFLPNMIVSNALVSASQGGIYGRPDVEIPGTENLYIVGDWVGPEGLLADASLSSAKRAAEKILKIGNEKEKLVAHSIPLSH